MLIWEFDLLGFDFVCVSKEAATTLVQLSQEIVHARGSGWSVTGSKIRHRVDIVRLKFGCSSLCFENLMWSHFYSHWNLSRCRSLQHSSNSRDRSHQSTNLLKCWCNHVFIHIPAYISPFIFSYYYINITCICGYLDVRQRWKQRQTSINL